MVQKLYQDQGPICQVRKYLYTYKFVDLILCQEMKRREKKSDFDKFFSGDDVVEDKPREHADPNLSPDGRRSSNFIGENNKMK